MVFPEGGKCKEAEDLLAVQTQIPSEAGPGASLPAAQGNGLWEVQSTREGEERKPVVPWPAGILGHHAPIHSHVCSAAGQKLCFLLRCQQ
jgi:hypothetical protein